jgi:23S rRNA-/tRNA-specific pseudouridylate synthase
VQQKIQVPSLWWAIRTWIVHRLDKDTEWLMIIATSQRWLSYFWTLFQEKSSWKSRSLIKEYTALCKPNRRWVWFIYQTALPYEYESIIQPKTPHSISKNWKSIIQSFQTNKAFCIAVIQIITGRTHQIRIQLSQLWLPIVGDWLYWCNWDFLHLTSSKLEFVDPDWVEQQFSYHESWN